MDRDKIDIKIFMTYSPNKHDIFFRHPLFYPIVAGSVFQTEPLEQGFIRDDEAENISEKNRAYCELTTQYWVWKNIDADYYGFCHYRRLFSFSDQILRESDSGSVIRPTVNQQLYTELCLNPDRMRKEITQYDFLVAKGIPASALQAKNLKEHYGTGRGLHESDLEIMLGALSELYPEILPFAKKYLNGTLFYPCNMFIAKRELFCDYSKFLFDVLQEVEKRIHMETYSREGYRTIGHLGERLLGIYFEYLKAKGTYRLGEKQMVLLEQTERIRTPKRVNNEVSVVMAANDAFVPVLSVCIRSLFLNAKMTRMYHVYVLHQDISKENREKLIGELQGDNRKITFINVSKWMSQKELKGKNHITKETYYRFCIPELFKRYNKVLYLDCDMVICDDVGKLFDTDMGLCAIGAACDVDFIGQCNGANKDTIHYCRETLRLRNPLSYFQAGVLLFHIANFRKITGTKDLLRLAVTTDYNYSDQDILNVVCEGQVHFLPLRWNVLTNSGNRVEKVISYVPHTLLEEYEEARKKPSIIHYAGADKPWKKPRQDYAKEFWEIARKSDYYEDLLYILTSSESNRRQISEKVVNELRIIAKTILPEGSLIRRKVGALYWRFK